MVCRSQKEAKARAAEARLFDAALERFNAKEGTSLTAVAEDVPVSIDHHPPLRGSATSHSGGSRVHAVWIPAPHHAGKTMADAVKEAAASGHPPVVALHGYSSGAGIYYASLARIALASRAPVLAIDTVGCGLSSRPKWSDVIRGASKAGGKDQATQVEDYFAAGLEAFRVALEVDKMVILGHSLGAYNAVVYAEKHPQRVERLILAGCAGIPEMTPEDRAAWFENRSLVERGLLSLASYLWRKGANPMSASRVGFGALNGFVRSRVAKRLASAAVHSKEEHAALVDYLMAQWDSDNVSVGGYAHSAIFHPGAYAQKPLWSRFARLEVRSIHFIYGDHDWLDPEWGRRVRNVLLGQGGGGSGSERLAMQRGRSDVTFTLVDDAGHNAMVDQPDAFADAVIGRLPPSRHGRPSAGPSSMGTDRLARTGGQTWRRAQHLVAAV